MDKEPKKKKIKSLDETPTKKARKTKKVYKGDTSNKKKKTNQKNYIKYIVIICLLVFIFAATGYYYLQQKNSGNEQAVVAGDFLPDGKDAKDMSAAELKKYAQTAADDSAFNMVIAPEGSINLADGTGKVQIQNPTTNSYPISVDLIDDQTRQVIYESGSIQPGQEVTDIKIEPGLELNEGDVKATAVFNIYDPGTKSKQGEVNAEVTLKITK